MKTYVPITAMAVENATQIEKIVSMDGRCVGILDDRLDIVLTEHLEQKLRERLPKTTIRLWAKPNGYGPSPDSLIREVASQANAVIVGIGM